MDQDEKERILLPSPWLATLFYYSEYNSPALSLAQLKLRGCTEHSHTYKELFCFKLKNPQNNDAQECSAEVICVCFCLLSLAEYVYETSVEFYTSGFFSFSVYLIIFSGGTRALCCLNFFSAADSWP